MRLQLIILALAALGLPWGFALAAVGGGAGLGSLGGSLCAFPIVVVHQDPASSDGLAAAADDDEALLGGALELPSGVLMVVNKGAPGGAWLVSFDSLQAKFTSLPHAGVHEVSLASDHATAAVQGYEVVNRWQTEGEGRPSNRMTLVDMVGSGEVIATASTGKHKRPHGLLWTRQASAGLPPLQPNEEALLVTTQLDNSLSMLRLRDGARIRRPPSNSNASLTFDGALPAGCGTPHLLTAVPGSTLVFVACRGTNPGSPKRYPGMVAVRDLATGEVRALEAGRGAEGLDASPDGKRVWVANQGADSVSIFAIEPAAGTLPTVNDVSLRDTLTGAHLFNRPFRVAFDETSGTVAVASKGSPHLSVFDASTLELKHSLSFPPPGLGGAGEGRRGSGTGAFSPPVTGSGVYAAAGFFFVPHKIPSAVSVVSPASGAVLATIYLPYCWDPSNNRPVPVEVLRALSNVTTADDDDLIAPEKGEDASESMGSGGCRALPMSSKTAIRKGEAGMWNWSGGVCPDVELPEGGDRRWMLPDGIAWSPRAAQWLDPDQPESLISLTAAARRLFR